MGYIRANITAMPRVKSDAERGATGVWLRSERLRREWTPDDVVRRLADLSYPIRVDYYRGLESGAQKPGPELLAVLKRLYGSEPTPVSAPQPSAVSLDIAALVDAIRDLVAVTHEQTALLAALWPALNGLVDETRSEHTLAQRRAEELERTLGAQTQVLLATARAVEARLVPANTPDASERLPRLAVEDAGR